jgi:hypothetical protein
VENGTVIPQKLNIEIPYVSAVPILGICPKELKAGTQTDIFTPTKCELGTLFTIAKKVGASTCLQTDA